MWREPEKQCRERDRWGSRGRASFGSRRERLSLGKWEESREENTERQSPGAQVEKGLWICYWNVPSGVSGMGLRYCGEVGAEMNLQWVRVTEEGEQALTSVHSEDRRRCAC